MPLFCKEEWGKLTQKLANPEQRQRACRSWGHNSTSGLVPTLLKPV